MSVSRALLASMAFVFATLAVAPVGAQQFPPEHLSGIAMAVDWAISRGADSGCGGRALDAEFILCRGGEWRRLEIG